MIVFDNDKRFVSMDYKTLRKHFSDIRTDLIRNEAKETGHTGWELLWGKEGLYKQQGLSDEQKQALTKIYDNYQKYEENLRLIDEPAREVLHERIVAAKRVNDATTHIYCLSKMYEMELKQHELLMNYHQAFVKQAKEIVKQ